MEELLFSQDLDSTLLKKELAKMFPDKGRIAVKLHYGEEGNKTSLRPEYAKALVDTLKELGCEPFLFDSSTMYGGKRGDPKGHKKNAENQGFTEKSIGCPLEFEEDIKVYKTDNLEVEVCRKLIEADGMVVLSHVKGHPCSGFGAAIKNLGMGGVSKKTKTDIHSFAKPVYEGGCTACRHCQKICPFDGIEVTDHPEFGSCGGCDICIMECPQGCLRPKVAPFDLLLSEGALPVVKNSKAFYINVMKDITRLCDCLPDPGERVCPDIGVLYGKDIVAIDKASMDMINDKAGKDIFKEIHHKSPLLHIKEAEMLGMGSTQYKITRL